jgi:hypothetical protein
VGADDERRPIRSAAGARGGVSIRNRPVRKIGGNERPDLCRELPNWMFDESYCAVMAMGPPEISIEGLNELAAVS